VIETPVKGEDSMLRNSGRTIIGLCAAFVLSLVAVPDLMAAGVKVTVDTPWSFRASFSGVDTDPYSLGGNDFQVFTFNFWTVLVNLRTDAVDVNGNASGFYEIQLTHTGALVTDPTAPVVKASLVYSGLQPDVTLTDKSVSSQPHDAGSEYLSTTVNITFSPSTGTSQFNGSIAGDSDLDGDGQLDSQDTDAVVDTLKSLKDVGIITGKEMGQIIKQTKQPIKQ
jgi:hypothetical protein